MRVGTAIDSRFLADVLCMWRCMRTAVCCINLVLMFCVWYQRYHIGPIFVFWATVIRLLWYSRDSPSFISMATKVLICACSLRVCWCSIIPVSAQYTQKYWNFKFWWPVFSNIMSLWICIILLTILFMLLFRSLRNTTRTKFPEAYKGMT